MSETTVMKDDRYFSRYAKESESRGIKMRLIGHWIDLAAYYAGSDGNAWMWHNSGQWVNEGPLNEFIELFPKRHKGLLY